MRERFLMFPELRKKVSLSRATIWRMERNGDFPSRVQISHGRVAWLESAVEKWMLNRGSVESN